LRDKHCLRGKISSFEYLLGWLNFIIISFKNLSHQNRFYFNILPIIAELNKTTWFLFHRIMIIMTQSTIRAPFLKSHCLYLSFLLNLRKWLCFWNSFRHIFAVFFCVWDVNAAFLPPISSFIFLLCLHFKDLLLIRHSNLSFRWKPSNRLFSILMIIIKWDVSWATNLQQSCLSLKSIIIWVPL